MIGHRTGTREEWLAARAELLDREKEHTRLGDELAQQRRELPWVPVEKEYRLDTDAGVRALVELFDGRSQLLVYHFMFGPSYEVGCPVNSSIADAVDGVLPHLHARDMTFVFVSQAPLEKLQAYKRRIGWKLLVLVRAQRLQLRPRVLEPGGTDPRGCRGDDEEGAPADRRAQRQVVGHRRHRLPDGGSRFQRVRARRRRRLPHLLDDGPWIGVPHELLPDPRPRAERPRRGRRVASLAAPARRVLGGRFATSGRRAAAH